MDMDPDADVTPAPPVTASSRRRTDMIGMQTKPFFEMLSGCYKQAETESKSTIPMVALTIQLSLESDPKDHPSPIVQAVYRLLGGSMPAWHAALEKSYKKSVSKTGNKGPITMSAGCAATLDAASILRASSKHWWTSTDHVVEVLVSEEYCGPAGIADACKAADVTIERVRAELERLRGESVLCDMRNETKGTCDNLVAISTDYTKTAERGEVIPMSGRDVERHAIHQYLRSTKSGRKIIIIGEAGTGKKQLIKHLALKGVRDNLEYIVGLRLRVLAIDYDRMGVDAEARLRAALMEAGKCHEQGVDCLLFFNHLERFMNDQKLAPLLREALAQRLFPIIATTEPAHWKKMIRMEPILESLFQVVRLHRPDRPQHLGMARSHADVIRLQHKVLFTKSVIEAAVDLCNQFASHLPEPATVTSLLSRAVDVLESESAGGGQRRKELEINIGLAREELEFASRTVSSKEAGIQEAIEGIKQSIRNLQSQLDRIADDPLGMEIDRLKDTIKAKEDRVFQIGDWILQESDASTVEGLEHLEEEEQAEARTLLTELRTFNEKLQALEQRRQGSLHVVGIDELNTAAENLFRIRLRPVSEEEANQLRSSIQRVYARVLGQEVALRPLLESITTENMFARRSKAMSCFLLVGPPGTGKTATGYAIAQEVYGNPAVCLVINCTQFKDDNSLIDLIGDPYERQGGRLTRHIQEHMKCVIVFDELEKGGSALQDLVLNMTGRGYLEEAGSGTPVITRSALVIATSNVGQHRLDRLQPGMSVPMNIRSQIEQDCRDIFRPEVMSRFSDLLIFTQFSDHTIVRLAFNAMDRFVKELQESISSVQITIQKSAAIHIKAIALEPCHLGRRPDGRHIERLVDDVLKKYLAMPVLTNCERLKNCTVVRFHWQGAAGAKPENARDGSFVVTTPAPDGTADLRLEGWNL